MKDKEKYRSEESTRKKT